VFALLRVIRLDGGCLLHAYGGGGLVCNRLGIGVSRVALVGGVCMCLKVMHMWRLYR